ncbi:MAG: glycosyltransferase [Rhodospirillaceae bacterium]|nr:glycosyltransferase [Rhodospirillaceae bacterium]
MVLALATALAGLAAAAWVYLVLFHGRFWHADQRLPAPSALPAAAPDIAVVIPARNEAEGIGATVESLLTQDYSGRIDIVVVDDGSDDGTAEVARAAAARRGADDRLRIVAAPPLPPGWSGKLWAVHNGLAATPADRRYVLLTDADIVHGRDALARLVAKAETGLDLVSLMVRLHCESFAERLLIPAFVFFFQKLYPFPAVNDSRRRLAGAAGGCMLVRRAALDRAGGVAAIKGALIDDCALAAALKRNGPIWLGLADTSTSLRRYPRIGEVWRMVARTAYTQLRHSPLLVAGTVLGMSLLYLVPPLALLLGLALAAWPPAALGGGALALMLLAYLPTWRMYRGNDPLFVLLPFAALLYTCMTVDSARQHRRGRGGAWKGRTYPTPGERSGAADGR